jgi:hypothetical protein
LFFGEALELSTLSRQRPARGAALGDGECENLVQLSLESHAPLPLEHLAYGWRASGDSLLYYATARERLRQFLPNIGWPLFLLPDFLLAPAPARDGAWVWIATPGALTAVRFAPRTGADADAVPAGFRSWPWDEGETRASGGESLPAPPPDGTGHVARPLPDISAAWSQRDACAATLPGEHEAEILFWGGASIDRARRTLTLSWNPAARGASVGQAPALTTRLPVDAAWRADVRERAWLARERRNRAGLLQANRLLKAAAVFWVALLAATAAVRFQTRMVDSIAAESGQRAAEVAAIEAKTEILGRLDALRAGEISNKDNSFYDALATLNHFRPQSILFTRATGNAEKREITVSGSANSMQEVSAYVESLRTKTPAFAKVSEKSSMVAGSTNFDITVTVRDLSVSHGTPLSEAEQGFVRSLFTAGAPADTHAPAGAATPTAPATPPAASDPPAPTR